MNWSKAVIAGIVGGIVLNVYDFIMHVLILGNTYQTHTEVFRQDANTLWFILIDFLLAIAAALFFAKSRSAWSAGVKGGVTFGFWLGLIAFLATFFNPLLFEGFPYFLTWCWGSITFIGWLIFGAVAAAIYKEAPAA